MWGHFTWNRTFMLESDEQDENFGNKEAWDYISTFLCGENDWQSCCFFLRGETGPLARLGSFQIRVGQQGSRELLSLLRNISFDSICKECDCVVFIFIDTISLGTISSNVVTLTITVKALVISVNRSLAIYHKTVIFLNFQ